MASTALNYLNTFTPCEGEIRSISDLINDSILRYGDLGQLVTLHYNVNQGDGIGYVGQFDMLGQNAAICNPTWDHTNLAASKKEWALGPFMVKEEMCADDFENTIFRYTMNTGTERADLTNTDLMNIIVRPKLEQGILDGVWRVVWHGDTAFQIQSAGGIFSNNLAGQDVYFNMTDGLWKRLFTAVPTGSANHVTIAANSAASAAEQYDDIFEEGIASGIFRNLILRSSPILRQQENKVIICTQTLADALAQDLIRSNPGSQGQWDALFDGSLVTATRFMGIDIMASPKLDEMIQLYNNLGDTYYLPHRAVFASKSMLNVGLEDSSLTPNLDVWFDKNSQTVKMLARTRIGTQTLEDGLISMAY